MVGVFIYVQNFSGKEIFKSENIAISKETPYTNEITLSKSGVPYRVFISAGYTVNGRPFDSSGNKLFDYVFDLTDVSKSNVVTKNGSFSYSSSSSDDDKTAISKTTTTSSRTGSVRPN